MSEKTSWIAGWRESFRASAQSLKSPRTLAGAAVLIALNLVLNQATIPVSAYLEIGFDFLATVAIAFMYGPVVAATSGVVTDLMGYMLRPNGAWFPGFTINAILLGILYGLAYYRKPVKLTRIIVVKLIVTVVFNLFLTPLWLSMMYGKAFVLLSGLRLIKNIVKFPVDVALLWVVLRTLDKIKRQMNL